MQLTPSLVAFIKVRREDGGREHNYVVAIIPRALGGVAGHGVEVLLKVEECVKVEQVPLLNDVYVAEEGFDFRTGVNLLDADQVTHRVKKPVKLVARCLKTRTSSQ